MGIQFLFFYIIIMEKIKDPITAFLVSDKSLPNASVVLSFKYQCNWFVLQKLLRGQPCLCLDLAYASENTCVAYSIYEIIKDKLMGSPLEQSKSKVSMMTCNYQNGEFIMSFSCPNSLSIIKKNIIIIISKITPHKYYTKYSHNIKLLNGKPFKNEFLYCSNLLNTIKINIFIIGKFNITDDKFTELVEKASEKFIKPIQQNGDKPISLTKNQGRTDYITNKADGYKSVFVRDFIKSETGLPVVIHSGEVIVYNKTWYITSKKITENAIKKYSEQKYVKLKDKFIPMTLYIVATECLLDIPNMIKMYKDNPSPSVVAEYIKKSL
jgi:hypothetical protein